MYAAEDRELRKDWYGDDPAKGRHRRFAETLRPAGLDTGIIANIANTDYLQAIPLLSAARHTRSTSFFFFPKRLQISGFMNKCQYYYMGLFNTINEATFNDKEFSNIRIAKLRNNASFL